MTKIVVAMSGGADSAVAAFLLKNEGYEVIGLTAEILPSDTTSVSKTKYAKRAAAKLKIPHYVVDLKKLFEKKVITNFCQEYKRGRTPNPCIRCNKYIKFNALLKRAKELGAGCIATGHYSRVEYNQEKKRYFLKSGLDRKKDQSYFLYTLSQEQLKHTIFPLGNYEKKEVKKIGQEMNLPVTKEESQEICFIPGNEYGRFIKNHSFEPTKPGLILDKEGTILGKHQGIIFYTIGQRRGLRIASGKPLYVTAIDRKKNAIIVGERKELFCRELIAHNVNFISIKELKKFLKVKAKIRYSSPLAEASIFPLNKNKVQVKFARSQWAITPGQSVVFYDGKSVLGGGEIS